MGNKVTVCSMCLLSRCLLCFYVSPTAHFGSLKNKNDFRTPIHSFQHRNFPIINQMHRSEPNRGAD